MLWLLYYSHMSELGTYIRNCRTRLHASHSGYSIRAVAQRIGIHHSYLSKLERGEHAPLTDERIKALARELGEDEERLLALGGRLSPRLSRMISKSPKHFLDYIVQLEVIANVEGKNDTYANRLEHRKNELEHLARLLRDEIKNRQRLETELIKAEAEKKTILTNLKDVVVEYIDTSYNLIWISPAVEIESSRSFNEIVGGKCYNAIYGYDHQCPDCGVDKAVSSGEVQECESIGHDGRRYFVRVVPIRGLAGKVERVVRFGFDITELFNAREALVESERRWRFALEGAREGVWDWDLLKHKVYYSKRWKEILGFVEGDIGDTLAEWESRIHPDDFNAVYDNLANHLHGKSSSYECEHRMKCKDGSYKWILDRGMVVERNTFGKPVQFIGTSYDITRRKRQEKLVRENESFLSALISSIQEGISVVNSDLVITYVNPVIENIITSKESIVGKSCFEAYHGKSEPCLNCPAIRSMKSRKSEWDVIDIVTRDGSRTFEVYCYPIIDDSADIVKGVVEFVRDVTDKNRMKAALVELENRYKSIFDSNPTVQLLINPVSGAILEANAAAVEFYKYSKIELNTLSIFDLNILPVENVKNAIDLAVTSKRDRFNFKHRIRDGSIRDVECRVTPIQFEGKTLVHSLIIDVTDRNNAIRAIRFEIDKLETLIESIPDIVCLLDEGGRFLALNKKGRESFGLSATDCIGMTIGEISSVVESSRKPFLNICTDFESVSSIDSKLFRCEKVVHDQSGAELFFDTLFVRMSNRDGTHKGAVIIARDITEIRSIERRQVYLASIIENTSNICVIKDLDLRVIATNRAFARAAGKSTIEEMIGKTDAEIFSLSPSSSPVKGYMDDEKLVQSYRPGEVLEREEEVIYPDKTVHYVSTRKFPIFDANKRLMATANISTDITDAVINRVRLKSAEKRYRNLVDGAPISICTIRFDGSYVTVNPAHAIMFGYDSVDDVYYLVGNDREMYLYDSDYQNVMSRLKVCDYISGYKCLGRRKDGASFLISRTLRTVSDFDCDSLCIEIFTEIV